MEALPEFVTNAPDERSRSATPKVNLTGWETVVFQVEDDEEPESDFSTAAIAP
jgi:hypothetical protein